MDEGGGADVTRKVLPGRSKDCPFITFCWYE